jgi:PPOX class probable F420-dependent enzyme
VLDETTDFGRRAAHRLRTEIIGWLTTVTPDGAPRPIPIWFLWEGDSSILLYSRPEKRKLANVAANPNVALHLDSDRIDADIVICWGEARRSDDPPASEVDEYVAKYAQPIARLGWTPESFAADFSVPLRIEVTRIHGW